MRTLCTIMTGGLEALAYGVGPALRHERVRRNLSLAAISGSTRISTRFLNAIEEEDFDQLPGIVFVRNFVRQYAVALELDPDPLLAQLPKVDIADSPLPDAPVHQSRRIWDPRWNSAISSVTWLLLALGAGIGAYVHFNRPAATRAQDVVRPAEKPRPPVVTPSPVPPPSALPVAVASTAPAPVPADPAHRVEVVLTAREASWVQVSADGKIAFTATLQPGETRSVGADDQVKVVAGNAGGVALSLNGKPLDPIGPSGQVRTVRLTAAGLQLAQKTLPLQQQPPDPL